MTVVQLVLTERSEHDTWRLLSTSGSGTGWHTDLEPALEELAETLSRVSLAWNEQDIPALAGNLTVLTDQAGALGLFRIARVSSTAVELCPFAGSAALGANVARLLRLGRALFEDVWRLSDRG